MNSKQFLNESYEQLQIQKMKNLLLTIKYINSFLKKYPLNMQALNLHDINPPEDFEQQYRIPFNEVKQWKQYLAQNGFVVVKNFLPKQKCSEFMNEVWDMMDKLSLSKLKRNDIETQKISDNYPSCHHGGLMQYIGHAKFQWQLRKLAKPIFQELWEDKDLKTSFDGVNFSNGLLNFQFQHEHDGLHVDQPPIKKKLWSYQGIMALTDAGTNGGGFVCVPKSHIYFTQYFKDRNMEDRVKAYSIPQQDRYKQPLCNYLKVNSEAGDFILFDSRTFHTGCPPSNRNLRVVTYICMMPTKLIPEKIQQQRKKAFQERFNSGHHCGDGFRIFSKMPRRAPKNKQDLVNFEKAIYELNQAGSDDLEKDQKIMELV